MASKSLMLYECDEFKVRLEYDDHLALLHLPTVTKFNKTVLYRMQTKVIELLDFLYDLGYNGIWAGCSNTDEQIKRLLHLLGFNYIKDENEVSFYNLGVN